MADWWLRQFLSITRIHERKYAYSFQRKCKKVHAVEGHAYFCRQIRVIGKSRLIMVKRLL